MRDSTIIYRSFYEAIKELPKNNRSEVWDAIFEYSLNFNELELKGLSKTIFTLIKPQLEANIKRWKNGTQPKGEQDISENVANDKQNGSKTVANNNVNKNPNNNVNKKPAVAGKLNTQLKKIFIDKVEFNGGVYVFKPKDGVAMAEIQKNLTVLVQKKKESEPTDEDVSIAWKYFLDHITDKWVLENFSLPIINMKWNELVLQAYTTKPPPPKLQLVL